MNWTNVKLIFFRELRDQLRDRRTLFTIAVLPLLLYPLLGMSFLQVAQFMKEHPTRVLVVGAESLPPDPALLAGDRFHGDFCSDREARLLELVVDPALPDDVRAALDELGRHDGNARDGGQLAASREVVQQELQAREADALVYIPADFAKELTAPRDADGLGAGDTATDEGSLQIKTFLNSASDKSRIASQRVDNALHRWREAIVRRNLEVHSIPATATKPFELVDTDVAADGSRRAAVWSKILPFVVLIWALTGAFYPAIDLCAGEKERGTLETLLSSPALRGEIVWGKLLTIMTFSIVTSLLNLLSMGLTGLFIIKQMGSLAGAGALQLGPPPIAAMGWLVLAIVPISALFSALSLAIAAFARSSKEGQYYLMPLLLITLPLMMLPMLPAVELDLGTSLIPVTGVMLLLRTAIEGQYLDALRYVVPVVGVTAVCCLLSLRWAVRQFNTESVLFRESERWSFGLWLRHLVRDRGMVPTFGEAVLCGVVLLVIQFFAMNAMNVGPNPSWPDIRIAALVTQIALIATPAVLMAIMLTRSPRRTLLLNMPKRPLAIPAVIALAVCIHPCVAALGRLIQWLYPMSESMQQSLQPILAAMRDRPLIEILLIVALLPAICEELAFRGFILSGLRQRGNKWTAIIVSSMFFGVIHGLLQQSMAACIVGLVIGYVAVQAGSLLPCVLFHLVHNGLFVLTQRLTPQIVADVPLLQWLFASSAEDGITFRWPIAALGGILSCVLLMWFRRLPSQPLASDQPADKFAAKPATAVAK